MIFGPLNHSEITSVSMTTKNGVDNECHSHPSFRKVGQECLEDFHHR
jgi:hypothetical protein